MTNWEHREQRDRVERFKRLTERIATVDLMIRDIDNNELLRLKDAEVGSAARISVGTSHVTAAELQQDLRGLLTKHRAGLAKQRDAL